MALRAGSFKNAPIGSYSATLGFSNIAEGDMSTAIGSEAKASGDYSIAGGEQTEALGRSTLSLGRNSIAAGDYSIALGLGNKALGLASITAGSASVASGHYSAAIGIGVRAKSIASLAIGILNDTLSTESGILWRPEDRVFVIGDGIVEPSSCFYILKNGNAWMQGTLTQNSDARLKTNIHRVNNALDKIRNLNGYTYNWKDSAMLPGIYTGVLAQEVQQAIPELVIPNTEGQLAVNYNGLIPYLIESIKTLEKQNEALQDRLNKLEKKKRKN